MADKDDYYENLREKAEKKAHEEYMSDRKNWPLNAQRDYAYTVREGNKAVKAAKEESEAKSELKRETRGMKKGGKVKSASSRADGIAQRGKTKGRMV